MDKFSCLKWDNGVKVLTVNKDLNTFINKDRNHNRVYLHGKKDGNTVFAYADRVSIYRLLMGTLFLICLFIPMMFLVFVLFMFKQREEIKHGLPKEYIDGLKEFKDIVLNKRILHIYETVSNTDELNVLNAQINNDVNLNTLTQDFIKKYSKDDEC